jgi:RimJ/RimL family protein N-acetyltransferase
MMFGYIDKDRERLRRFLPWVDATKSVQDTINFIKMSHEKWNAGELFNYGVFNKERNIFVGNIGLLAVKWEHECCEIGCWIAEEFEGKGFISDAVTALEIACFEKGFHHIEIRCNPLNKRSASVPIRLGYHLDGTLVQNAIEMGRHRDTSVFGKINPKSSPASNPAK